MSQPRETEETRAVWGSSSFKWTLTGTIYLLVTGLVILLAPFSRGAQLSVLLHTAGGLLFLVPLLVYLVPHFVERWKDRFSHLLLLGYSSGVLMLATVLSGIVLTWQAALGRRIDYGWDLVHTVAGCALGAILAVHLWTAVRRQREGEWVFVRRLLLTTATVGIVLSMATYLGGQLLGTTSRRQAIPEGYSYRYGDNPFAPSLARTDRLWRLDQDGRWLAFLKEVKEAPADGRQSLIDDFLSAMRREHRIDRALEARGESHVDEWDGLAVDARRIGLLERGALDELEQLVRSENERHKEWFKAEGGLSPDSLAGSQTCGTSGCHEEILAEWEPSAHRYSSRSAFFQLIQGAMAEANGAESTRYCAGCHDPIALFSGAKHLYGPDDDLSSPGADEGISCAACHSIVRTDLGGNANYVISPPERYVAEESFVGRFLVRAYPRHHRASYSRPLLRTPEFCAACHKQFIDEELNRATRVQLQNQYDSWRSSQWFVPDEDNPQQPDPERSLACSDCHMREVESPEPDPAWSVRERGGRHRHHGYIAANQWLPLLHDLPHADRHVKLTEEWLKGETVIPEIADRWPAGPPVPVSIEAPESVRPGEKVTVRVVVDNRKVGHSFPTGPLDIIQAWFDVRATLDGKEVFRSGRLDDEGFIQEGAFMLKAEGVDRAGNLIDRHNLWDMVGARFRRVLFPGYTDQERYTFELVCEQKGEIANAEAKFEAPDSEGELVVTATLRYRKVDQTLLNVLYPDGKARAPVTDMTTATARIRVVRQP